MQKKSTAFFLLIIFQFCYSQLKIESISPVVNQKDSFNIEIIKNLGYFLVNKDTKYWLQSDFEIFKFPFHELKGIESGKEGAYFYKPSIMEIIPTEEENKRIVKIAFIGYHQKTKTSNIKAIYNVVAIKINDDIFFSKYLNYFTRNWTIKKVENITYIISPTRSFNIEEAFKQKKEIKKLSEFFSIEEFSITYFSTVSPEEVFRLKGFDYHPMMYVDKSGGFAEEFNIVISGNNSEYYNHEVAHLFISKAFTKLDSFFNEGLATYLGGSGKFDYLWQKNKLKEFLKENPKYDFFEHLDIYERFYFQEETPIPYLASAIICEMIIEKYGKEKLFEVLREGISVIETLKLFKLEKENLNNEMRQFLEI